jgi:WD40 repeat protein
VIHTHRWLQVGTALLAVLSAACIEAPSAPRSGTVRVAVRTSGGDADFDGYEVVVDPARRPVDANGTAEFRYIGVGTHNVALEGVADNCRVVGTSTQSVAVVRDEVVSVRFEVECATTGIAVTTHSTGLNIPDSVDVSVVEESPSPVPANGLTVVSRLRPGKYTVALALRGTNCSVVGSREIAVEVAARTLTPVLFELACTAPVRSEKIAFTVDTTNRGASDALIEVINVDGSEGRVIGRGRGPSWSPDGRRVAFSDARCGPNDDGGSGCSGGVIVVDPELGSLTRPPNADQGFSPTWAPGRDTIAFVGCCGIALEPTRLLVVGLGDSPARELELPAVRSIGHPVWSPDGQRIAFSCVVVDGSPNDRFDDDLCIVERDGSEFKRLASDPVPESDPAWSPDGRRIAFTRGAEIALLNLEDGVVTRLTEGREPSWSPDGSMLVFAGDDGLFTITADGSIRRRLTSGRHRTPAWRP